MQSRELLELANALLAQDTCPTIMLDDARSQR